jgi:thioredoxin reductase
MGETYDVVVIGGGAAGLSGALVLGRARRSVLVIDAGEPRNAPAARVHNYLGHEGTSPEQLLAIGRREVQEYGVHLTEGTVMSATQRDDGAFVVTLSDRWVTARRLLVTTGLVDELPNLPEVAAEWGRTVVHCPYCHGWEVRDRAIGVLAGGASSTQLAITVSIHQAQLFRQWSSDVALFLHTSPPPSEEQVEQLEARGIRIIEGRVAAWEAEGVRMDSGEVIPRQALVVGAPVRARAEVLLTLATAAC